MRCPPRYPPAGPRAPRGAPAGFTLIELCLAAVMLGILLTVAGPRVASTLNQTRVQQAAAVTAADIERAFSLAQRTHRAVVVTFDPARRSYKVTNRDLSTTYTSRALTDGEVGITQLTASATTLEIGPNGLAAGLPVGGSLGVVLRSGTHARRVTVSRAGRVRVTAEAGP